MVFVVFWSSDTFLNFWAFISRLKKKFVTLGPFLLFFFLQKRLSRCVGSVFVTRSKKYTVADVGHSDNKAVKRNVKMPKGPAKC